MTIFAWGDSPTWDVPWLRKHFIVLDASSKAWAPQHAPRDGDVDAVPDPTEYVQVSREYRSVAKIVLQDHPNPALGKIWDASRHPGDHMDLTPRAWALFRERGGGTAMDWNSRRALREISSRQSKGNKSALEHAQLGWDFGWESKSLPQWMRRRGFSGCVPTETAIFAHIAVFLRMFFVEDSQ